MSLLVSLVPREPPLAAAAVVASGPSLPELAKRLLARSDEALRRLEGVTAGNAAVVLGEASDLPWADGVVYLGVCPDAPALLMPTTERFSAPAPLVEKALRRSTKALGKLAVLGTMVIPLEAARPLARAHLLALLTKRP